MPLKLRHILFLFLAAIAIAVAIFCFNFFALGYSLSDLTTFFLAKDSRIQERIILQPGTSTGVSIVAGTQTDTWVGNPDDSTLPRIVLDGADGKWKFKNRGTDTTASEISSLTQASADSQFVKQSGGVGTGNILTDPTCIGGTQSGNTELMGNYVVGTETIAKQKIQYLADVTGYVQSQLNSKENSANKGVANGYASLDVNGKVIENPANGTETSGVGKIPIQTANGLDSWLVNMYVNKILGSSGNLMQGQIDFVFEGDIVGTSTYDSATKKGTQTFKLATTAANRADILEGDTVIGTQSTELSFDEKDFNLTQISGRSVIALEDVIEMLQFSGTATPPTGTSTNGRWVNLKTIGMKGDFYDKLIIHANTIGTSTFTDSTVNNHLLTGYGATVGTSTDAKFGSSCIYSGNGSGNYAITDASTDFNFSSGNWTIDFWFAFNDVLSTNTDFWENGGAMRCYLNGGGSGAIHYYLGTGDGNWNILFASAGNKTAYNQNQLYHFALTYDGSTYRAFIDGVLDKSVAGASVFGTNTIRLGDLGVTPNTGLYIDEVRISKGVARWTSDFTPPTQEYSLGEYYDYHVLQYIPPGTTTPALSIVDDGTNTTKNYILLNATTVGFGYGTTTDITGTTSTYVARGKQGAGGILVDSLNTYSTEEIKSIVDAGERAKFLDTWKNLRIEEWYRKKPEYINNPVDPSIVADKAKERYKQKIYQIWYAQNIDKYTTTMDDGTGSTTTFIDVAKLEVDYGTSLLDNWYMANESAYTETEIISGQPKKIIKPDKLAKAFMDYGELLWMSELEQSKWLEKEKVEIESDTDKLNVSLIVNDPTTPVYMKTKDGIGRDLGSELGSLGIAFQELIKIVEAQGQEIESLRALLATPTPTP